MAELNVYKETSVPASAVPNAWYLIKEGANPFFTLRVADSAGTLIPLGMDVLGTLLAGYSTGANSSITSTDSVLQAFQKTQGQINNLSSAIAGGVKVPLPLDASGNPNYPAATKGDSYIITVSGKIGGALGIDVTAGDVVNALNNNAGGTQSEVGSDWYIIEGNKDIANDTTIGLVRRATIGEVDAGTDVNAYVSSGRLRAGVLATAMLGLSIGVSTPVVAGDNLITTIGKIQAQINNRVVSNTAIVAGTHTKISYDVKGLVTGGANLVEADIPALSIGKITGLQLQINSKANENDSRINNGQTAFEWGNHTSSYMLRSSSSLDDPNQLFVSSAYRVNANPNNPTDAIYSFITFGSQVTVVSQIAGQIANGELYTRAYNTAWSPWRRIWDSVNLLNINQLPNRSYNDLQDLPSLNFVPNTRSILNGAGITGGGDLSANRTIGLTGLALAFHNLATNGFAVRTAVGVVASRAMTGSNSISVANGDGVAGNPTFTMRYAGTIAW